MKMPVQLKVLKRRCLEALAKRAHDRTLNGTAFHTIDLADFDLSVRNPTDYYLGAHRHFHLDLDPELKQHRAYFREEGRGFGEDAFHVMWWYLLRRMMPSSFLEIGVYRGQTLSLAALIARLEGYPCEVHGISPFTNAGDSVSTYQNLSDYREDVLHHFDRFKLQPPILVKALSSDSEAVAHVRSKVWDCIYIDGNHDQEAVAADWHLCASNIRPGGCIVLDDAGLTTRYRPPRFSTGGHPGPSQVAMHIDRGAFTEILQVGHNRVFRRKDA